MTKFFQSRQVREGGYSGAYILVFVAILVAVNWLANEYNKTYDATSDKLYSLSDQTRRILRNLENDVTIYHFDRREGFNQARGSLVRYENASNRVRVRYVDPDSDPALAETMNIRSYGTTMVEIGASREEARSTSEEHITNAIIKALKGSEKTACLLTGHGEADPDNTEREGFSIAHGEMERANYQVQEISLLETPEIPASCTVLIVAGPEAGYLEPEIELLRQYVEQGGRLLLLLEHAKSPELAELVAGWGIQVNDDVVVDLSGIGQLFSGSPLAPLISEYDNSHPITEPMGSVAAFFPMTRSVVRGDPPPGWRVTELMKTTSGSFATTNLDVRDGELIRDPASETSGPVNVAVAAAYDVPDDDSGEENGDDEEESPGIEANEGRVVVVGTSRFARNYFVSRGGNLDIFLNMLNWLTSDEDLISIRPRDPASTPMDISSAAMRRMFFGLVLGLPLVIVVLGVRTWWVRR